MPVELGDLVRVKNLGNEDPRLHDDRQPQYTGDFTVTWNSRDYRLPVGQEVIIPFELAKKDFGDPRAGSSIISVVDAFGIVSWVPDRPSEIRRLRAVYDNQGGTDEELLPGTYPKVEVTDLDGNPLPMVLNDPTGESVLPARLSIQDNNDLMALIRKQQAQINLLMEERGIQEDLPEDEAAGAVTLDDEPLGEPPEDV